jgi:prepilin-type N-terminal cleavage/methylation domain-containing protein
MKILGSKVLRGGLRRQGGFSLIEVLIAMLVLSLGAGSILSLFAAAAATHRRSVDRTHAALVAERVLSEVRSLYLPETEPSEILDELRKRLPSEIGGYRWEAMVFHPEGDAWSDSELFARVTVRWPDSASERADSFQTILLPLHRAGELEPEK